MIKKLILAVVLSASAFAAMAAPTDCTISATWDLPTLREDGTSLAVEEIQGYVISNKFEETKLADVIVEGGASTSAFIPCLGIAGVHELAIATTDTEGRTGSFSPSVLVPISEKVIAAPAATNIFINFSLHCEPEPCNLEIK